MNVTGYIIRRGDIYNFDLGMDNKIGSEQRGLRPCVVVSNNVGNKNSSVLLVVPLTSQTGKAKLPTHVIIENEFGLQKRSIAMGEQSIVVSKDRIVGYIGNVRRDTMQSIDVALSVAFGLSDNKYEAEAKTQATEVKYWQRNVEESLNDGTSKAITMQKLIRLEIEMGKLSSICNEYRLNINNYIDNKESMEIINSIKSSLNKKGNQGLYALAAY